MAGEKPHSFAGQAEGGRLSAPSALRNQAPILKAIAPFVPKGGKALEIASGTGEHAVAFAEAFPDTIWQPTDIAPDRLASIDAWRAEKGRRNMRVAQALDATTPDWRAGPYDLIVTVNLLHLISAPKVQTVIAGVARNLRPGGHWFLYGPFRTGGGFRSDGDRAFDAALKQHDPAIGYKGIEDITRWAEGAGLASEALIEMPANNLVKVCKTPRVDG